MSIIIAGTIRVPPSKVETFAPYMKAMVDLSRQEDGCLEYSYAFDVAEEGLVRVFEIWRDEAAIGAHFTTSHLMEWRGAWAKFGVSERHLIAYEVASQKDV